MLLAKLAEVQRKRDPQHIHKSIVDYLGLLQDLSEYPEQALWRAATDGAKLVNDAQKA